MLFFLVRFITYVHTTWCFAEYSDKFAEGVVSCVMVGCLITKPQLVYLQYIKNLIGLLGIAGNFRDMAVIAISCNDKCTNCAVNIVFQFCKCNSEWQECKQEGRDG